MFETFPDTIINIELKNATREMMLQTNMLIKEFQREDITIWGGRLKQDTAEILTINPNAITFFSAQRCMYTYFAFILGLLPFLPIREHSMQVPMPTKELLALTQNGGRGIKIL